ncbi:MAG TPA: hypothetical protein VFQ63_02000 [Patescibacteria group bacterium]|nr:hypothetical protein [Patescibacteria group bacterium]
MSAEFSRSFATIQSNADAQDRILGRLENEQPFLSQTIATVVGTLPHGLGAYDYTTGASIAYSFLTHNNTTYPQRTLEHLTTHVAERTQLITADDMDFSFVILALRRRITDINPTLGEAIHQFVRENQTDIDGQYFLLLGAFDVAGILARPDAQK